MANRYWLKLNEHFLDDDKIVFLESKQNGEKYILVWIKILLKCLKNRDEENIGFLRFTDKIPYTDELLSRAIKSDIDTVRVAMKFFTDLGMIEILEDGTIYVEEVQKMLGRETGAADRMRKMRERKKLLQIEHNSRNNVTDVTCNELHNKELDKEKETEEKSKLLLPLKNELESQSQTENQSGSDNTKNGQETPITTAPLTGSTILPESARISDPEASEGQSSYYVNLQKSVDMMYLWIQRAHEQKYALPIAPSYQKKICDVLTHYARHGKITDTILKAVLCEYDNAIQDGAKGNGGLFASILSTELARKIRVKVSK
jgi:predicted phage replisome organizer